MKLELRENKDKRANRGQPVMTERTEMMGTRVLKEIKEKREQTARPE